MHVFRTLEEYRQWRDQAADKSIGLVPTMGYLHKGHESLIEQARAQNSLVVVWIFVNPKQFAAGEDLSTYPRNEEEDLRKCEDLGVDVVLIPDNREVYPAGFCTAVETGVGLSEHNEFSEGASRPTFFRGVATVVMKIFNIVRPQRAYFGQKDAQQCVVVRTMVRDLNMNLQIVVLPIVREEDGLAMSSRNAYLSADQRQSATVLYRALSAAANSFKSGVRDSQLLKDAVISVTRSEPQFSLQYVSVADPDTLIESSGDVDQATICLAGFIGSTRLIDNIVLSTEDPSSAN